MAVAYASHDTATNETDTDSLTIAKPTGLAAGDMMVAVLGAVGSGVDYSLSGWTSLNNGQDGAVSLTILFKVASSGDASATNFTFTHQNVNTVSRAGILYRITGTSFLDAGNFAGDYFNIVGSDATPTYTGGATPAGTTALLIMGALTATAGTTSSTYAVTNNNPTWTERCDLNFDGTADITLSSATGSYAAATTTGDFSLTLSGAVNSYGYLIAVSESASVTVNPAVVTSALAIQTPSVTGGSTASPAVITATATVQAPTVTTEEAEWKNTDKSAEGSTTNVDKS